MKSIYRNLSVTRIVSYKFASSIYLALLCFSSSLLNINTALSQTSGNTNLEERAVINIRATISTLIGVLGSQNAEAKVNAARALGGMGTQAKLAEPALMVALNDKEAEVRYSAATAIANLGGDTKAAFPHLLEAIQNESKWVRNDAASALSNVALNLQIQARNLSNKELDGAIADVEKTLEVMENSEFEISSEAVKSVNNSLDLLKREKQRG